MSTIVHPKAGVSQSRVSADTVYDFENYLAIRPDDIQLRYSLAMSYCESRDLKKVFEHLSGILLAYHQKTLPQVNTRETKRFVGLVAVQMALLAEFYRTLLDWKQVATFGGFGLKYAKMIAAETHDGVLGKEIDALDLRYYTWQRWHADVKQEDGVYIRPCSPLTIQLEPTNCCNLQCRMCPRQTMNRPLRFFDSTAWEKMIATWSNRVRDLTLPHLVFPELSLSDSLPGLVKLYFMGEPLLHPQLDVLIKINKEHGVQSAIQTNGKLLSRPSIRQRLLDAAPDLIAVSIDGFDASSYENIRHGASWEDLLSGMISLEQERKARGLRDTVRITVNTILPEITQEAWQHTRQFLAPLEPYADLIGFTGLNQQFKGTFYNREGTIDAYEHIPGYPAPLGQPVCMEALEKLNILSDETVTPCCYDINGDMSLGMLHEGIDTIWQKPSTVSFHSALLKDQINGLALCRRCKGQESR